MSREDAAAALQKAGRASESVRRDSRWAARYLVLFALAFAAAMLVFGLVPDIRVSMPIFITMWVPLVIAATTWANRQRSAPLRLGRWFGAAFAGTGVLYAAGLFIGLAWQRGNPLFWIPAALVAAAPMLVIAWLVNRR